MSNFGKYMDYAPHFAAYTVINPHNGSIIGFETEEIAETHRRKVVLQHHKLEL